MKIFDFRGKFQKLFIPQIVYCARRIKSAPPRYFSSRAQFLTPFQEKTSKNHQSEQPRNTSIVSGENVFRKWGGWIQYILIIAASATATYFGYHHYHNMSKKKNLEYKIPGDELNAKTTALSSSAKLLQKHVHGQFSPLQQIHMHLCGFHCYSGDTSRTVRAHHFCKHLNEDLAQCVIYESENPDARLIGIEYVISERLYQSLPDEEKRFWHSHVFEVESGELIAPGIPELAEKELMKDFINTYGKTVHTWQIDRGDILPIGPPQLMMAFTEEGQVNSDIARKRDEEYQINRTDKVLRRADIKPNPNHPEADFWYNRNEVFQLQLVPTQRKA